MTRPNRSQRLYRWLLGLFPVDFRLEYRDEMEELFRLEHREVAGTDRADGRLRWRRLGRLWLRAFADLARSVPREHADALVQDVRRVGE